MDAEVRKQLGYWIEELSKVGTFEGGGMWRTPFTDDDIRAKELLAKWMTDSGMTVTYDNGGNVTGSLTGGGEEGAVLTGSHLDSVKSGGRLDGTLGILAGLAVAAGLRRKRGTPKRSIDVVALCGEEQSRFRLPFIGSKAIVGTLKEEEIHSVKDDDGVSVAEAMERVGLDPTDLASAKRNDIAYFVELHIEQGPVLEAKGLQTGIVTDIVGITQKAYTILGDADHGGTTPMTMRHDALRGAVRVINEVPSICQRAGDGCVATVGIVDAKPGGPSSVPASFHFTLDVRDREAAVRQRIVDEVHTLVKQVIAEDDLDFEEIIHAEVAPTPLDPYLVDVFDGAAESAGITRQRMHSGAGHDAMIFARHIPTGMIFVPSKGGKSHTPKEFTALDDIMPGIEVMYRGFEQLAYD